MAAAATQERKITEDIPATFPPGTLFVAVCDDMRAYAGEDGGPQHGGKGRWRVGEVGPWTADSRVPLAHRNPEDGLIWKGWLEVCTATRTDNGRLVAVASEKVFTEPTVSDQRARRTAEKEGKMLPKKKAPSAKATKRATQGAPSMADALKPLGERDAVKANAASQAGVVVRDSDRIVG